MKRFIFALIVGLFATTKAFCLEFPVDWSGKTVGVQLGTVGDSIATDAKDVITERYNKSGDAIHSLLTGKIDAVLIDEQNALAYLKQNSELAIAPVEFGLESYAIAVENNHLKDKINGVLSTLKHNGVIDQIFKNHTERKSNKVPLPLSNKSHRDDAPLTIATNAAFPPYEYHENGEITGIDIDIARLIADRLNRRLVIEDMEFDTIINAVKSGKADMGIAGMTVSHERMKNIGWTQSYITTRQALIVRAEKNVPSQSQKQTLIERFKSNFVTDARWKYLTAGLVNTLIITVLASLIGLIVGGMIAIVRTAHDNNGSLPVLNLLCRIYLTVIRGTPAMIQLLIMYYVVFSAVNVNKILVAVLAFGLNSAAYVAEIARAGILSVDKGQTEAGRSLGLSYAQTMGFIVLPQAFKNVLPALANEFIVLIKETSICGYIGLTDLTRGGDIIRSLTYDAFMPLMSVALIYLSLVCLLTAGVNKLEKRLKKNER